jgi:hypothetical protein
MKLTIKDYKSILKFYKVDISELSSKDIKAKAEHYLAVKLCRCIKNVKGKSARATGASATGASANSEKRAIAVCYNSVLKKKNLKVFKFSCKKKVTLLPKKGTRKIYVEKLGR